MSFHLCLMPKMKYFIYFTIVVILSSFHLTAAKLQIFSGGGLLLLMSTTCKKCQVLPFSSHKIFDPDGIRVKTSPADMAEIRKKCIGSGMYAFDDRIMGAFARRTVNWCGNNGNKNVLECCHERSICPLKLKRGETKKEAKNDNPFAINRCDCEFKFGRCLRKVGNAEAKRVFKYHFSIFPASCFTYDHPFMCERKSGAKKKKCTKSVEKPKRWQIRKLEDFP